MVFVRDILTKDNIILFVSCMAAVMLLYFGTKNLISEDKWNGDD